MSCFKKIVVKKYLNQVEKAYDIVTSGCLEAAKRDSKRLFHLVLTSLPDYKGDLFSSFQKFADMYEKEGNGFEFFVVEARNKNEGLHLHVIVSDAFIMKSAVNSRWSQVSGALINKVIPFEKEQIVPKSFGVAIVNICKYITFGNHRESMVRYGFSEGWLKGDYE